MSALVIAGTSGDAGKTAVSLALLQSWRLEGRRVTPFKKGPDYIDRAWLSWASGREGRNLDLYLMEPAVVDGIVADALADADFGLLEGARGLHDSVDLPGQYSTAALAAHLGAPVVLLIDARKTSRTAAAVVLGCRELAPSCDLRGVILNRVGGSRHETQLRRAIEGLTDLPVLGAIGRDAALAAVLPSRHLGLVTPQEHPRLADLEDRLTTVAAALDRDRLRALAQAAAPRRDWSPAIDVGAPPSAAPVRIGYARDAAFTFYYPDNLDALVDAGAELVPFSVLGGELPSGLDALYLGGGFPETHAARLADNQALHGQVRRAVDAGLPVYAECGGLLYLSRSLSWQGARYPLVGVFPVDFEIRPRPQGFGYMRARVRRANPFVDVGVELVGHEFHYSRPLGADIDAVLEVTRGHGLDGSGDGLLQRCALGQYLHLHAAATPGWAPGVVAAARRFRAQKTTPA